MRKSGTTVFVGVSGGVDSSVAALRLMQEGYTVVGVFIKVWQPPFLKCDWEAERLDAMRVCATLGIPFLTCDASERYKTDVVDYLVREYREGRTPNPDVMCNKHVKFGAFLDFADVHGADFIATGHYAQREDTPDGPVLLRGVDTDKDQSYFLWTLTSDQLSRTLLPIGASEKAHVRADASTAGLPTASKPDSQGICFLGALDMKEFLFHFIPRDVGQALNTSGVAIGTHDGACFYTIGQRHGFHIAGRASNALPYFVVEKDVMRNTITVSTDRPTLLSVSTEETGALMLSDTIWRTEALPEYVSIQTRYRQAPVQAQLNRTSASTAQLIARSKIDTPAIGQSCVIYDKERCLGGGIISAI